MNYENFKQGFDKPSIFTAQQYGTKVSVEVDHSDMDLDEVMDAFQTLIIGLGYHENSFKNWVIDRAQEYNETDAEDLKEKLEAWKFDDDNDIVLRHQYESREELEDDFFGPYDIDETRMNIIGQNGNEGLHYDTDMGEDYEGQFDEWDNETPIDEDGERYLATDEDEDEFSNDGGFDGRPHFEWGDEPEDNDNLFEGDEWEANDELKAANERYKKALKTLSAKQKKKSK